MKLRSRGALTESRKNLEQKFIVQMGKMLAIQDLSGKMLKIQDLACKMMN